MLWYFMDGYKNKIDKRVLKKWKEIQFRIRIALICLFVFGAIYACSAIYLSEYPLVYGLALFLMIFDLILLYIFGRKEEINEYTDRLAWHQNNRLDKFRDLLKEDHFRFYSQEKIEFLIDRCNDELPRLRISKTLFKPVITVFSGMILPIVIYGFTIYSHDLGNQAVAYILIFAVIMIMYILGLYYMLKPTIEKILDSKYYTIVNIKNMLQDIILMDFLI